MKKFRKKSRRLLVRRIVYRIWNHPSNQDHRIRALFRAGTWQVYKRISNRPLTIRVYGNMRMKMHPDSGSCSNYAYFGEMFEHDEMLFVRRYLRPGDSMIDGGANVGGYTLLAASRVGPTGHIDSFEPAPEVAQWLRWNVELNQIDYVTVHEAALAEQEGSLLFTTNLDVSNGVLPPGSSSESAVLVRCVALDDIMEPKMQYTLAKLDLEGAEVGALLGAQQHLAAGNPSVLLVEAFPGQLRKFGSSVDDLFALLEQNDYLLGSYSAETNCITFDSQLARSTQNVLAVHVSARQETERRLRSYT